jgi:metal-responsive CopG/Arc/MetJ family transcriptional regulator
MNEKEAIDVRIRDIDDLLTILVEDREWLYLGSREDAGFLRAMKAVKEKRDALEREKEHVDEIEISLRLTPRAFNYLHNMVIHLPGPFMTRSEGIEAAIETLIDEVEEE